MATTFKSLAEKLAELEGPVKGKERKLLSDYDPENISNPSGPDGSDDEAVDDSRARAHYVSVGKSKLRDTGVKLSGAAYSGSKVSRADMMRDGDDDDPFGKRALSDSGSGDEDDGEDEDEAQLSRLINHRRGDLSDSDESSNSDEDGDEEELELQGASGNDDDDDNGSFDGFESEDDDDSDNESGSEEHDNDDNDVAAAPAAPKSKEAKTVAQLLHSTQKQAGAASADARKGDAVRAQRKAFDSVLAVRIKLQNALVGTNSLAGQVHQEAAAAAAQDTAARKRKQPPEEAETAAGAAPAENDTPDPALAESIQAARTAALSLWASIDQLRQAIGHSSGGPPVKKHKRAPTDAAGLAAAMAAHEAAARPVRQQVLQKWSDRTRPSEPLRQSRLRGPGSSSTGTGTGSNQPQPVTDFLASQLNLTLPALVGRTRIPRSCAPAQAALGLTSSPHIFDDADLYGLLLRDLLEQRGGAGSAAAVDAAALATGAAGVPDWHALRRDINAKSKARRHPAGADTRVSRGRKLSYAVHEKLLDFASAQKRDTWPENRATELFAGLLGRKDAFADDSESENEGVADEAQEGEQEADASSNRLAGLRLF